MGAIDEATRRAIAAIEAMTPAQLRAELEECGHDFSWENEDRWVATFHASAATWGTMIIEEPYTSLINGYTVDVNYFDSIYHASPTPDDQGDEYKLAA